MNLKRRLFIPGVSPRPDASASQTAEDAPVSAAPASEPHPAHAEHAPAGRRSLAARIKLKREARFGIAALLSFLILVGILITSHGKAGKGPPAVGIPNPNVAKANIEKEKDQDKKENPTEGYGPSPELALRGSTVVPKPIPDPEPEPEPVHTPPRPIAAVKLAMNETSEGDGLAAPESPPTPEPEPRAVEKPTPIEMQPAPAPVAEPAPSGPAEPNPPDPTPLPKPAPVQEPAPAPEPVEPAPSRTPESAPAAVEPLGTPGTPPAATTPPAPVAMPEPMSAPDVAATRVQAPAASETAPIPANPRPGIAPVPSNETPDLATPGQTGWVALPNTRNARTLERSAVPDVSLADRPTAGDPGSKELVEPVPHVVQRGENFWTIARQYYNSGRYWKALWAANRQKVPVWDQLYVGTTIRIPPPELLDQSLIEPPKPARASATLSPAPVPLRRTSRPILNSSRLAQEEQVALPADEPIARPEKARFIERAIPDPDPDLDLEAEADGDPDASVEKYEVNRPVYKVKSKFETLRSVARDRLGDSRRADEILDLNADVIKDPNHLVPGQLLELPEDARVRRRKR